MHIYIIKKIYTFNNSIILNNYHMYFLYIFFFKKTKMVNYIIFLIATLGLTIDAFEYYTNQYLVDCDRCIYGNKGRGNVATINNTHYLMCLRGYPDELITKYGYFTHYVNNTQRIIKQLEQNKLEIMRMNPAKCGTGLCPEYGVAWFWHAPGSNVFMNTTNYRVILYDKLPRFFYGDVANIRVFMDESNIDMVIGANDFDIHVPEIVTRVRYNYSAMFSKMSATCPNGIRFLCDCVAFNDEIISCKNNEPVIYYMNYPCRGYISSAIKTMIGYILLGVTLFFFLVKIGFNLTQRYANYQPLDD